MKRRKHQAADSLELLLDTICNTFGGVLFIAILVVILLQLSGDAVEATPHAVSRSSSDAVNLKQEWESLREQRDRLRGVVKGQAETLMQLAPPDLQKTLKDQQRQMDLQVRLTQDVNEFEAQLSKQAQDRAKLEQSLLDQQKALAAVIENNEALQKELALARQSQQKELRTSVVRSPVNKLQVPIVLQYGRLYFWQNYDRLGFSTGLNTDDFLVLEEGITGTETTPNPAAGIPVNGNADEHALIVTRLRQFKSSEAYFTVIVRPDSFSKFGNLRDAIVEASFEYALVPSAADDEFINRGGSERRIQ